MPVTDEDLLDGKRGQVTWRLRIDVLDPDGGKHDEVTPSKSGTVAFDPSNRITRTWSGVEFDAVERLKVTPYVSRLRPVLILALTGGEFPLGVFLYKGGPRRTRAGAQGVACRPMPDRSSQMDKTIDVPYGITAGRVLTEVLAELFELSSLTDYEITPSDVTLGAVPMAWFTGQITRLAISDIVTDLLGYLPVYFTSTGAGIARPIPVPLDEAPDHVYELGARSRLRTDSIQEDEAERPNVYLVRSTAPSGAPIAARHEIADEEPQSFASIGYWNPNPVGEQTHDGLESDEQALDVAVALSRRDKLGSIMREFDSDIDPRHDGWGIVQLLGVRSLERSWEIPLPDGENQGGPMHHVLTGVLP